jgi:N-acetylglutamate synthase-like GNAT family acetyltransferase
MKEIEEISNTISNWTKDAGTMLPKSPEIIKSFLEKGHAVIIWEDDNPVAFAAVTFEWPNNNVELGALVVEPSHRGMGIGHLATIEQIAMAKKKFPGKKLFALCNEKSLKIMLDLGAEIITEPNTLPHEVFGECIIHCPKYQQAKAEGKLCCDTPVMIKNNEPEAFGCHR